MGAPRFNSLTVKRRRPFAPANERDERSKPCQAKPDQSLQKNSDPSSLQSKNLSRSSSLPSRPLLLALALSAFALTTAQAQGGRERPRYTLQALDLDHDGTLSAQEILAAPTSLLNLDRNGDGQLTPDELEPPRPNSGLTPDQLVDQLMALDRNHDGVLTPDELPDRLQPLFQRADTNHDGKLTPDEIRHSAAHAGMPIGPLARPGSASGAMRLDPVNFALDLDHDGTLSAAEIHAAGTSLLVLDQNHDGKITPDEMRVRQQTPAERAAHVMDEYDTNKDGKLSPEELPDGLRPHFTEADRNQDGVLDLNELTLYFAAAAAAQPASNAPAAPEKGQPK